MRDSSSLKSAFVDDKSPLEKRPRSLARGLSEAEWRRRFWHIAPGIVPFALHPLLAAISFPVGVRIALTLLLVGWFVTLLFERTRQLRRGREPSMTPSILGYALPVALALLAFPRHLEIGFSVLVLLAFGDGLATLGGLLLPHRALPWNTEKSWGGLLSFTVGGAIAAALVYHQELGGPFTRALPPALALSSACALAETLRSRWNDNIRVGVTAALLAIALYAGYL